MPNGRQADEKKNHLEFLVSSSGYTLLTNSLEAVSGIFSLHANANKLKNRSLLRIKKFVLLKYMLALLDRKTTSLAIAN
ncbi:hypothetical protein PbJCM13498_34790 [Prolixibacter bellariivorans]|uniref:Uncharacterized protein n=1 Tax=Prolixibacter bellariivorans TaxID=314319 RepID=A0A5M4B413_9BACT|nr:hypothetical protein PbJCM13498_34790 [Prolixibacter bellariivorans]